MKVLAIGGGGMLGSHTVGRLCKANKDYDVIIGVSTGAMMAGLVAIKDWDKLKKAYTTTSNKDIFTVYPFDKKDKLSIWNTIIRSVRGFATVGETKDLQKFIQKWFTKEDFKKLQECKTEVIISVLNITTGRVEYKSSKDSYSYDEFTKYIAAASCPSLLTSIWNINGYEYSDSGLATLVPIVKGSYIKGVTEIDCYVHRQFTREMKNRKLIDITAPFQTINHSYRSINIQRENLEHKELREGVLRCLIKNIPIKIYFMDNQFNTNSMVMNPKLMNEMWQYGYENHNNNNMSITFTKDNWEELFNKEDDE